MRLKGTVSGMIFSVVSLIAYVALISILFPIIQTFLSSLDASFKFMIEIILLLIPLGMIVEIWNDFTKRGEGVAYPQ